MGAKSGIAGTLYQLGKIFFEKENFELALRNFQIAADIAKKLRHPNLPMALNMINNIKSKLGQTGFQKLYKKVYADLQKSKKYIY